MRDFTKEDTLPALRRLPCIEGCARVRDPARRYFTAPLLYTWSLGHSNLPLFDNYVQCTL